MDEYEFEVRCNGDWVASSSAPDQERALHEALKYAMEYEAEGAIEIYAVLRHKVSFYLRRAPTA